MKTTQKIEATNKVITPLTIDEVKQLAPAVFQTKQSQHLSKYYQFFNTGSVVEKLIDAGFVPFRANQRKFRSDKKNEANFQFHQVTFFHPDFIVKNTKDQIEEIFEISVSNSHDGTSKFSLRGAFYRLACENGMLGISNDFGHLVTRHMGQTNIDIDNLMIQLTSQFDDMAKNVKKMKSKLISNDMKMKLAKEMAIIRHHKQEGKFDYDLTDILKPIREQDKGNSLWNVYNVIQEKLIKGYDFSGGTVASEQDKKAARKLRAVKHFESQMFFNKMFWEKAKELV